MKAWTDVEIDYLRNNVDLMGNIDHIIATIINRLPLIGCALTITG